MAALPSWNLMFQYLDDFFTVFREWYKRQQFGKKFYIVCANLSVSVNNEKKQPGCVIDFFRLEFDTI